MNQPATSGSDPVRITFLGGLGEIGRNCAALETRGRIVVLDCGQMFAGDDLPGVDAVLPDLDWLFERGDRVDAVIATHAHEDHIGALPYLLTHLSLPIFGSPFTLGMIEHKLREADLLDRADLRKVSDGDRLDIGPFDCEFLPVTHSIPSGNITAFHTDQGVILHSSDFKLDLTPVDGRRTDLSRIGALAAGPGIRLLLCDSTNADRPGSSRSEREVGAVLAALLRENEGRRVVVASFASHIHRLQQIADAAIATGRVVVTLGLSMRRNVKLARDVGILRIPDHAIRDIEDIDDIEPERVCVICTGSQGEPRAALTQMAMGESRWLELDGDDTVIFSSHPIPGNEAARSTSTRRATASNRSCARCTRWRCRSGSSPCTANTPTSWPIATWPARWGWRTTTWCCARTATRWSSRPTGSPIWVRSAGITSTSTGWSAISATRC